MENKEKGILKKFSNWFLEKQESSIILILILFVLLVECVNPKFLSSSNLFNVLRATGFSLIVVVGMSLVLITGGLDLSVGSVYALGALICGMACAQWNIPVAIAVLMWKCPTCYGEYSYIIGDRKTGDDTCPYCSDRKILPGYNSFKVKHPDLMEEWCWVENIFIEVDPDQILDTDNQEVWWLCKLCGRKYPMSVKKRLMKQKRGHNPCSQCNGRRWRRIFNI